MLLSRLLFSVPLVIFLISPVASSALADDGSSPAHADATKEDNLGGAIGGLRLLTDRPLELSTSVSSAADRFSFRFVEAGEDSDGSPVGFQAAIVRDGIHCAITVWSLDGVCYCYATEGLFVAVDPANPGTFILHESGNPQFSYCVEPGEGRPGTNLGFSLAPSLIRLDLASLLKSALPRIVEATVDEPRTRYDFRTEHARGSLVLFKKEQQASAPIPIKEYTVLAQQARIGVFISAEARGINDFFALSKSGMEKRGLRLRTFGPGESITMQPPPGYGQAERQRAAAAELQSFLRSESHLPMASGPSPTNPGQRQQNPFETITMPRAKSAFEKLEATAEQKHRFNDLLRAENEGFQRLADLAKSGAPADDASESQLQSLRRQWFEGLGAILTPKQHRQFWELIVSVPAKATNTNTEHEN